MKKISSIFSVWQEVTSGERNQVVFENLHKTYGAYEIRTNYDRTLLKALSSIILFSLLVSGLSYFSSSDKPIIKIPDTFAERVDPPYIVPPVTPKIDPPVTPPGPKVNTNEVLVPIVADSIIEKIDSIPFVASNISTLPGNSNDTSSIGTSGTKIETGGTSIMDSTFTGDFLTDPPTFPGGEKALFGFLQKHVSYPESVKEMGGKGTVAITFVLDKEGNVTEVTALKASKYSELNNEALRVVKKLPKWNPGKHKGQPVKSRMILPIRFELKQ